MSENDFAIGDRVVYVNHLATVLNVTPKRIVIKTDGYPGCRIVKRAYLTLAKEEKQNGNYS